MESGGGRGQVDMAAASARWTRGGQLDMSGKNQTRSLTATPQSSAPSSPKTSREALDKKFKELDVDGSGKISRKELEFAMRQLYGKPLEAKVIDQMMADADEDGDGEIDPFEFRLMMRACEKATEDTAKLKETMGLWYEIKKRGQAPSKEQKVSETMRLRRVTAFTMRQLKIDQDLMAVLAQLPANLAAPFMSARSALLDGSSSHRPGGSPLPAGDGSPPKKQAQIMGRSTSPRKKRTEGDLEMGSTSDTVDKKGSCFDALPSAGEVGVFAMEFLDTYLPLLIMLSIPSSMIFNWSAKQLRAHFADPSIVAPPPPPAQPTWSQEAKLEFNTFALAEPEAYLAVDLGVAFALGLVALYWKDMMGWLERRRMRGSYQALDESAEEDHSVLSAQELKMQLFKVANRAEELEIKLRVKVTIELEAQLQTLKGRRAELEKILANAGSGEQSASSAKKKAAVKSELAQALSNTANGLVTVSVYFADVISDVQVLMLLYKSGNTTWGHMSLFFLVAQFAVIYIRVLPYLQTTFGAESPIYKAYLWGGFPFGSLLLDMMMFLEPFGLLAVLPLPEWLKTFIPAYKATRVIAEIFIESLPQCLLQSYILVSVMGRVHEGTARPTDLAMLDFAQLLPQSITISTLATLKTWLEMVEQSNAAGISIPMKVWQLWNVGGGLPLDALKKGAISEWTCMYRLDKGEISPLINALEENKSLWRLNLAQSGLEWSEEDSSGAPLISAMATNPIALISLKQLFISDLTKCALPVDQIRAGGKVALKALRAMEFFKLPGGPWHDEIMLMAELLRVNRSQTMADESSRHAGERIVRYIQDVLVTKRVTRSAWEQHLKQVIVEGHARRAHVLSLLSVEVLRGVGFGARELHSGNISLAQLREGCFTVAELKEALGVDVKTVRELGYSLKEMREGAIIAELLKPFGYSATEMRQGTFTAVELKAARYTLTELREATYSSTDLKEAEFSATQLRKVGFTVSQCRKAEYRLGDMRIAGYTAVEMRDGGYNQSKVKLAGYNATEATSAFSLESLREAGYLARELREAGHAVPNMLVVGFTLDELHNGGYSVEELQAAGFTIAQLKGVGTSLTKMKESGASIAELRAAGYTAARLRTEKYGALELMDGGFDSLEMEKAGFDKRLVQEMRNGKRTAAALYDAGFSAKDLRAAGFKAAELKGSYTARALRAVGYTEEDLRTAGFDAWLVEVTNGQSISDLREAGYSAEQLKTAGFSAEELGKGGFTAGVLKTCNFSALELRVAGFTATTLKEVGFSLAQLKAAYFVVEQLQEAGFSDERLKEAGFTACEFKESGVSAQRLRKLGFRLEDLKREGFTAKEINGSAQFDILFLRELKEAGFMPKELKNSGIKCKELKEVGFPVKELEAAGFGAELLFGAGFSGADLRSVGFKASTLKAVGYTAGDLKAGGFTIPELKECGYVAADLKAAKISPKELREYGFTAVQLKAEGFTAKELLVGWSPAELKAVGYRPTELLRGGVSVEELKAIGYNLALLKAEGCMVKELKIGGFLAKELKEVGFSEEELKAAGFKKRIAEAVDGRTVKELLVEGPLGPFGRREGFYEPHELREAGFPAKDLKLTRLPNGAPAFDANTLKSVGYTAEEMRLGGYALRDLLRECHPGYTTAELKKGGFSALEFVAAPCSILELRSAGFSAAQCMGCGLDRQVVAVIYGKGTLEEKLQLIKASGTTCQQAKTGGLLPSDCKKMGYTFDEGVAAGFTRKVEDWMTMGPANPHNKWGSDPPLSPPPIPPSIPSVVGDSIRAGLNGVSSLLSSRRF